MIHYALNGERSKPSVYGVKHGIGQRKFKEIGKWSKKISKLADGCN